jgi:hypothetical protein
MQRSIYTAFVFAIFLLGQSCKKEKLMTYNANDNIYFNYSTGTDPIRYADSTVVTFAFNNADVKDTTIRIPVVVTGVVSDHDRTYAIMTDAGTSAVSNTDYILPSSFTIAAGKTSDTLLIRLNRTAVLKDTSRVLRLRLKATDNFQTRIQYRSGSYYDISYIAPGDTISVQTFKVIVSDRLEAGPYWSEYHYYFGEFSEKKVRLMNQLTGMPLDFWSVDMYSSQRQQANATYYGGFMFRYLSDQAAAGNIITEADGVTPMEMGMYFQ